MNNNIPLKKIRSRVSFNNHLLWIKLLLILFFPLKGKSNGKTSDFYHLPIAFSTGLKSDVAEGIYMEKITLKSIINNSFVKNTLWNVFSDRAKNKLFNSPNGSQKENDQLDFLEDLLVKEFTENNWIHVFSREKNGVKNVDRGWIHASQLLLTNFCLKNENSLTRRTIITGQVVDFTQPNVHELNESDSRTFPLFYTPDSNSLIKGQANKVQIYYVLKEFQGKKLLSYSDQFYGPTTELSRLIPGWISTSLSIDWNSRLCLEVSSRPDAKSAYKDRPIPIFSNLRHLENFIQTQTLDTAGLLRIHKIESTLPGPYFYRYPILENLPDGKKKIFLFSEGIKSRKTSPNCFPPSVPTKSSDYEDSLNLILESILTTLELGKVYTPNVIGYTSTKFYGNSEACYSPVVFLSQGELGSLYKIFRNFKIEQLSATEKRAQFKQLVLNQTMSLIGEKNPDNIENMSLDEIWQAILGIPFDTKNRYQGISKVKIKELDKKGNEAKMDNFLLLFQNSINSFKLTAFENYKFEVPADYFYWIPLSKFPGNE